MHRHSRSILRLGVLVTVLVPGLAAAQDLLCGETLRRTLERKYDFVSFDAKQGEVVSITVATVADPPQDLNFAPEFQLQAPDGDVVFFAGGGGRVCQSVVHQCETPPLPLDGAYTLIVNDNGTKQMGTYTVTLEAVSQTADGAWNGPPDASAPTAPACKRINGFGKADGTQAIDFDTPLGGVIDDQGETDTFTFGAAAGQMVAVELHAIAANPAFNPRWKLFDPAGQPIGGDCDADEFCSRGPFAFAGVYTVKVFELDYADTGEYTLTLRAAAATSTTTTPTTTSTVVAPSTTTTLVSLDGRRLYELSRILRRTAILTGEERLGAAIAADDSTLVIGAPFDQTNGQAAGAVFVRSLLGAPPDPSFGAPHPTFQTLFKPDGSSQDDRFGAGVALVGDTLAVGAPGADVPAQAGTVSQAGAVYLFTDASTWTRVSPGSPVAGSEFGASLVANGNELFVGAPGQDDVGRVYLVVDGEVKQRFEPPSQAAPSDPLAAGRSGDRFGAAIAARGDLLAVGAPATPTREGRVYLYDRRTGEWRVLRSPTPAADDRFGSALAFVDTTLVIGAPGAGAPGAARLFTVQDMSAPVVPFGPTGFVGLGTSLAPVAGGVLAGAPDAGNPPASGLVLRLDLDGDLIETYRKPAAEDGDRYGSVVAATSRHILVGALGDDSGNVDGGAVYAHRIGVATPDAVFRKRVMQAEFGASVAAGDDAIAVGAPADVDGKGAVWSFAAQLTPCEAGVCTALDAFSGGNAGSRLGQSVARSDGLTVAGAPFAPVESKGTVGAAYLLRSGANIVPTIPNPEANPLPGDQFGFSVAAADTDILVGAPLLGTTDTGVVFVFQGGSLRRRLTLRNPTPTTGDFFGAAVAVESGTIAVGAPFDSMAASKAGAVYLFDRTTGELLGGKPLVSSEPLESELFGAAVAMSPEWIVVGAPGEDAQQRGRAYVFDRASRGLVRTIENPDRAGIGDRFGAAVAIVDGRVLVGAPYADGSDAPDAGAAYLFETDDGRIAQSFENPVQLAFDRFGLSLGIGPTGPIIGAPGAGRVYVYRRVAESGLVMRNAAAVAATAEGAECGNGVLEGPEQCDDGNDVNTDDCRNDCTQHCCIIDPLAADRCNDFDPCTDDSFDPATGRCVNADNGRCCTSDASCAGQDDVCRLCAGCSLYAWDCCDQGAACLLSSPGCQDLDCFDRPLCECQGGLGCDEEGAADPPATMKEPFLAACQALSDGQNAASSADFPFGGARAFTRQARRALRATRRATKQAYKAGTFSRECRRQYMRTIDLVKTSIRGGQKLRRCVRAQQSSE